MEVVLGIDLGTTNTCMAVMKNIRKNKQVEVIANDMGERKTPSYVAFTETEHIVGTPAKDQADSNPMNTIYEAKRLIGRKIDDPEVKKKVKLWPFKVVNNEGNRNPVYEVQFKNAKKILTPEQISAMILEQIKESAGKYLDCVVTKAVITVPAYFSDSQRQATIDAGVIAGLEVIEIINEPTAAAIAYGFDKMFKKEKNVLVFDFGGGTLDVAIIGIANHDFNVKAVSGDKDLGGGDIDNKLLEYFVNDIRETNDVDLMKDPRALGVLRNCCEKAKCFLSSKLRYTLEIKNLSDQLNFKKELSRAKFEDICSDLLDRIVLPMETALRESGLSENDIDEVILVGGSTRIPCVQERVEEFFKDVEVKKTINPDEAVAVGAAIRAATLTDDSGENETNLMDVIPHSLGVTVRNTDMSFIIPRNTKIPVSKTVEYSTPVDNQTNVKIEILEGENKKSARNNKLGEFILDGIEMAARGEPRIIVTLNVDRNGILTVSAEDVRAGKKNNLKIESLKGRLKQKEIDELSEGNTLFSKIRAKTQANTKARNELESFATKMKNGVTKKNKKKLIPEDSFVKINSACLEVMEWIENNPNSAAFECKKKFDELRDICTKNLQQEE